MLFFIYLTLFLKLLLAFDNENNVEDLKVCLQNLGCVHGTYMPGYQTDKFEAFMGIPYAVGDLRFKNPVPLSAWNGVLQTSAPKPSCIQKNYFFPSRPVNGEEDCLYLNVYRPVHRSTASLPVLFYIHGGGFFSGSAHPAITGPEYFMDTGEVILITISYRLGPFGFLSTADEHMPGNFGLKDQNIALKWVHTNIAAFGGDPNSVTIFGHSAGGSAVHFHMLSAASKGLFQRAIAMSGSALAPFVDILKEPHAQAVQIAKESEISNAHELSASSLADALRKVDALKILNAGDSLKFWHINSLTNFRPTLEHESWANSFLTERPELLMINGNFSKVPWLMGVISSRGEGAVIASYILKCDGLINEFNQNFDSFLRQLLELPNASSTDEVERVMNMIIMEYFQGKHELNGKTMDGLLQLIGDVTFHYPFYKTTKYQIHQSDAEHSPLRLLQFNYRGSLSYSSLYSCGNLNNIGPVHFDDTLYLFRTPISFPDFEKDSTEAKLMKRYVRAYVDFAKNGKAENFEICTEVDFYADGDSGICKYLEFFNDDASGSFKENLNRTFNVYRMNFWDKIYGILK